MVFYLWKENKRAAIEHFNGHWAIQYNLGHHFVVLDYPPILVHNIFIWIFHRFKDENGRRSRHFSWNSRYHHAHVPVYMWTGFTYTVLDFWSPPLPSFLYPSTLRSPSLAAALDPLSRPILFCRLSGKSWFYVYYYFFMKYVCEREIMFGIFIL